MQPNRLMPALHDVGVSIPDTLMIEHRLLREQMCKVNEWLEQDVSEEVLRERAALLAVALDRHAQEEEKNLFASLGRRSEIARRLIEPLELEHEKIRALFGEIQEGTEVRSKLELVLGLAEHHFESEEDDLFPLAAEFS